VEPVLLDPIGRPPARRTLAAEPPAELVHRDVKFALMLRSCQLKSRRDRCASAADYGNFDGLLITHFT
jgi:hypothetical protein